jgi:asparagine synthase (glutamine-hydrolysing)
MCGIVGIIDLYKKASVEKLTEMSSVMSHRGPDEEGYHVDGHVALGHRRLSIIDLESGKQPMSNEDGTIWITYNGEIYNFPEIKKELIEKGHHFKTRSDTETIIHAYEEYGIQCLEKIRGMFAFGIWDKKKRELFLARDRLGKKPLYYYIENNKFVFASEIKAILQDNRVKRELNSVALADYLTYNYIPFPNTIFKNIFKLKPAHFCIVKIRNEAIETTIKPYWDIKYNPDFSLTENDWIEGLREKIKEAVKIRLISDVPLGAFLSGGIDSSSVVAFMSMVQDKPVKTFSIGFREEDFSEMEYAKEIAKRFGTEHFELTVEPDAIEVLPKLAWEFDEPFADSSAIPTYYVSKMARQHVKVILTGDGGDEVFAGYKRYLWAKDMSKYDWLPDGIKKLLFGVPAKLLPEGIKGKGMLMHLSKNAFERYAGLNTFSDRSYLKNILNKDILNNLKLNYNENNSNMLKLKQYYESCNVDDYLTKIQYVDTKIYLAEDILTKVDRASMLCSLETRSPFLDHELVEFVASIPSSLKIKKDQTKYILKKTMNGVLPETILYRRKMGFGVPLVHWFKEDLLDYARDTLFSKNSITDDIFNKEYVNTILNNHQKHGRDLSARIWALLFFEHWSRHWM